MGGCHDLFRDVAVDVRLDRHLRSRVDERIRGQQLPGWIEYPRQGLVAHDPLIAQTHDRLVGHAQAALPQGLAEQYP